MADFFFLLFVLLCAWILYKVIVQPELVYHYPYFTGCMFAVFLVPQAISLVLNPDLVPPGSAAALFAMCFLCLLMAVLGYAYAPSIVITRYFDHNLDLKKLTTVAIVYALAGAGVLFLINRQPTPDGGNWTGSLTIFATLYQVINIALGIFVFLAVQKRKPLFIVLALLTSLPILQMIVTAGRREATALLILTLAFSLYDRKGVVPSRLLIVGGLVFTMLIMPVIGTYREVAKDDPWLAMRSMDMQSSFVTYFKEGKDLELTVAANMIDATRFYGSYDLGADYWNEMVFRYFPAQVFGKEAKAALMIGGRGQDKFYRQYTPTNGLTTTCIGDAYRHLWYFGCLFYFFLGGFFRELKRLTATSNVLVKIFYIVCMVQALLSITHGTVVFLPGIFHMFVFTWIAAVYAKAN